MKPAIIRVDLITRPFVRLHYDWIFLFGDNVARVGSGGQAKEMRGEPNCFGIPTKYAPHRFPNAYMSDMNFDYNISVINRAFAALPLGRIKTLCWSSAGIGTGLAELSTRAPKTFCHLQSCLRWLEEYA